MSDISVEYSCENLSSKLKYRKSHSEKPIKYFMYMTQEQLMKYFTK